MHKKSYKRVSAKSLVKVLSRRKRLAEQVSQEVGSYTANLEHPDALGKYMKNIQPLAKRLEETDGHISKIQKRVNRKRYLKLKDRAQL